MVVFRYPEEPEVSYIKRLVGLPGETIRIFHGDIYIKPPGGDTYTLGPQAVAAPVRDADRRLRRSIAAASLSGQAGMAALDERRAAIGRSSRPASAGTRRSNRADEWSELRYRNLVPEPEQWDAVLKGQTPPRAPRATLVTDFYSYNTNMMADQLRSA